MDNPSAASDIVRKALDAVFNKHDLTQIDRYWSPDFVQHSSLTAASGREGFREFMREIVGGIPDLSAEVDHLVAEGKRVAAFMTWRGTPIGSIGPIPAQELGTALELRTAELFQIRDGQIVEHWDVVDTGPITHAAIELAQRHGSAE